MRTLTLSITQFNTFVKNIFDAEGFLHNISVFGEVTNYKISGGNAYFDLKDENAMLSCVKFGVSDLAILLLSTYEIFYVDSIPYKVSVDEALNLAEKYSTNKSVKYINGVLAKFAR